MQVTVYSKDNCPFCDDAKWYLMERNVNFDEVKLNDEKERQAFYMKMSWKTKQKISTVPQIVVLDGDKEIHYNGFSELKARSLPVHA